MPVEPGQLRMMRDGTVVRVMRVGLEHTGYMGRADRGDYLVGLQVLGEEEGLLLYRAYGTVASYPLLGEVATAIRTASLAIGMHCRCCGTHRSLWPG